MGGHAAGEVASLTAVEALRAAFDKDRTTAGLVAAAQDANRAVWEKAQHDPELRGMGTTLVALALVTDDGEERLAIVNVGDSRVYLLRDGELEQLTTDHSLVQELMDDGQLSEAEATVHPQRHVLTRALGVDPEVPVDSIEVLPVQGRPLPAVQRRPVPARSPTTRSPPSCAASPNPTEAAKELVAEARRNGGNDNITVVVVDVVDDDDQAAAASAALAEEPALVIPSEVGKGETEAGPARGGRFRGRRRQPEARPSAAKPREPSPGPSPFRVVGFFILLLILLGGAVAAVGCYARGTYLRRRRPGPDHHLQGPARRPAVVQADRRRAHRRPDQRRARLAPRRPEERQGGGVAGRRPPVRANLQDQADLARARHHHDGAVAPRPLRP